MAARDLAQIRELFEVAPHELKHPLVDPATLFLAGLAQLREGHEDIAGGAVVGPVDHVQPEALRLPQEADHRLAAALQEPDVGGVEDVGRDARGVNDELAAALAGSAGAGGRERFLNKGHALGPDLGAEVGQPAGGMHVVGDLGGAQGAEALGVHVFLDQAHGLPVGEVAQVLEHERADLGAQGRGRSAAVLAVEGSELAQEGVPGDGGGQALEGMVRIEDELGEGQVRKLRLRILGDDHAGRSSLSAKMAWVLSSMMRRQAFHQRS